MTRGEPDAERRRSGGHAEPGDVRVRKPARRLGKLAGTGVVTVRERCLISIVPFGVPIETVKTGMCCWAA